VPPVCRLSRPHALTARVFLARQAMDHDAGSGASKLTPTVAFVMDIPEAMDEFKFEGRVFVSLKNAVCQPSSGLRAAAELSRALGVGGQESKPICILMTDGGHDHNMKNGSVQVGAGATRDSSPASPDPGFGLVRQLQVALSALFVDLDLDLLVAVRSAAHHSYVNPVERVMAILNIPLSGVAMERSVILGGGAGAASFESIVGKCGSMGEIREAIEAHEGLRQAFLDAHNEIKRTLMSRFLCMSLHEEPFLEGYVCSDDELVEFFAKLQRVDADLTVTDTTKVELAKRPRILNFWRSHAILTR
jgi:hypothetical protein